MYGFSAIQPKLTALSSASLVITEDVYTNLFRVEWTFFPFLKKRGAEDGLVNVFYIWHQVWGLMRFSNMRCSSCRTTLAHVQHQD